MSFSLFCSSSFIFIHYSFLLRVPSENCSCSAKLYCSNWAMRLRRRLSSIPSAWSSSRHAARRRRVLATDRIPLTRSENASKQFNELMSGQNVIVRINEQIEHNYTGHTDFYTPIFYWLKERIKGGLNRGVKSRKGQISKTGYRNFGININAKYRSA